MMKNESEAKPDLQCPRCNSTDLIQMSTTAVTTETGWMKCLECGEHFNLIRGGE